MLNTQGHCHTVLGVEDVQADSREFITFHKMCSDRCYEGNRDL